MIPKGKLANKLKIQILAGGISHERDISLKSARRLSDAHRGWCHGNHS